MYPCILSDRLYVHESYVTSEHLLPFVHRLADDDEMEDLQGFTFSEQPQVKVIRTYNRVRLEHGIYYGFSRGKVPLLLNMFGHIPWENCTACPRIKSELKFTKNLYNFEEHGIGQREAAEQWLKVKNGVIKAAPRFGKTVTSIYIIAKLGVKTAIITHQKDILQQFFETFKDFTNFNDIVEPDHVPGPRLKKRGGRDARGRIVGFFHDYDNPEELDVCLICWQTLASKQKGPERLNQHYNTWGLMIIDEVHRTGGIAYAKAVNQTNTRFRMGLTGTVERVDGREFLLHNIVGPVTAVGEAKAIPCRVETVFTGITVEFNPKAEAWPRLSQRLYKSEERLELILKYIKMDMGRDNTFICIAFHSGSVAQLNHFTDILIYHGYRAASFHGSLNPRDREQALEDARSGALDILVCNAGMLTGINVPRWNVFYCMFPNGNVVINETREVSGNYRQQYSRVQTPFKYEDGMEKKMGLIRDFVDDNAICIGLYKKRSKAYLHERFSVHVVENRSMRRRK